MIIIVNFTLKTSEKLWNELFSHLYNKSCLNIIIANMTAA